MAVEQTVFPDLASVAPGPELAGLLESLHPGEVPDEALLPVLEGVWRQISHLHAQWWAVMVELSRREPPAPVDAPDRAWQQRESWHWATHQIAAALRFTGRRTDREYAMAHQLLGELPLVWQALSAGSIDVAKAWIFANHLVNLTDTQIQTICARVLPHAPGWTTGKLAARLIREILALDPDYARRRYQRAQRDREVLGYLCEDGTATLTAHGLTPSEAAAAAQRLEQLAQTIHAGGHPGTQTQLRADLFVRLLDGRYQGLDHDQITAAMLAEAGQTTIATTDAEAAAAAGAGNRTADAKPPARAAGRGRSAESSRRDTPAPAAENATGRDARTPEPTPTAQPATAPAGTASSVPPATASPAAPPCPAAGPPARASQPVQPGPTGSADTTPGYASDTPDPTTPGPEPIERPRPGIEIRAGLLTLLGHNEHPAELPGWGPILATEARTAIAHQHNAEWRFAILDQDGYLIIGGLLRRRPTTPTAPPCRGGIVELHIHATDLTNLTNHADRAGRWTPVINEILRHYHDRETELAKLDEHPDARYPTTSLRRHLQLRDRTCIAPGCHRPARTADIDHTHDYTLGGLTTAANTEPLCPRHHAMKHHDGWTLTQPRPGHFHWRSPLGQTYQTRGEPIAPDLPQPQPNPDRGRDHDRCPTDPATRPIIDPRRWHQPHDPDPPPQPEHDDEPPPF